MAYLLPVEIALLYVLWRLGLLRRIINGLNARLALVANGRAGLGQRAARSTVRAVEYLELTRGTRLSPGVVFVVYTIFAALASTYLAGNNDDPFRILLALLLLFAVLAVVLIILMGGSMYIRAAQKNMARMLPEALGIMGNEITAGHSIEAAVQRVALQFGKPISQEFTDALIKMTASGGLISIDETLAEIAQNPYYQSDALDQAALTIAVVRPLGGDLGKLLSDLSRLLYEREATEREIRTQLAPGRQAAWSLVFIICGLFVGLTLFPLFRELLYGLWQGRLVLAIATIMIAIAVFWIIQVNSYEI